jgi:glycosyltransferase involved in cell wall biosynthesis
MLTIVIPSYNHEKYIVECLDAARCVDVPGRSIVVIDDGSADNTPEIVRQYIEDCQASDIALISKKNSGLVSSLNLGLEMIETEFCYFIASDDVPRPEGIKNCVELLASNHALQFCIGGGDNFFNDSKNLLTPIYDERHRKFFASAPKKRHKQLFMNYPSPLLLQSVVFRTKALREIGGWNSKLILDDYPTFVKLLSRFERGGTDFLYRPDLKTVFYRHHGSNSYKNSLRLLSMVKQALECLAPPQLKNRAIANAFAFYMLMALRLSDFKALRQMFKMTSLSYIGFIPGAAFVHVTRKLMGRK